MKQRWFIEQKKQHVAGWRASGLTRLQYCELNDIPFTSFREWPQDVAKAERRAKEPAVLPVHITEASPPAESESPRESWRLHSQLKEIPNEIKISKPLSDRVT
jgi:hypothetical protein